MSSIVIVGNIVADPEPPRNTDRPGARFSVAENKRITNRQTGEVTQRTSYYDCIAWQSIGANALATLKKGMRVVVIGDHEQRRFQVPGPDGNPVTRSAYEVVVEAVGPDLRWATADVTRNPRPEEQVETPVPAVAPTTSNQYSVEPY